MGRVIAVALLIFVAGTVAVSEQSRPASTAPDARAEAIRAIDESSAKLSELAAINARIMQTNAEMSRMYSVLSKRIAEVGKMAGERSRTQDQLLQAIKQAEEMALSFNLQYLMLQEKMQQENRQFTLLSNIMKTKHDTAKNSINNIR